jgi:hypothetical protein
MREIAMNTNFYTPSIFETFNARHLQAEQVARTFVPPIEIFSELVTKNNHILIGPRGSGKTTLLKMLTLPALANWEISRYETVIPRTDFVGIFVPADRGWHAQLKNAAGEEGDTLTVGRVAFTTHVLSSLIQTLRDARFLQASANKMFVSAPAILSEEKETVFVDEIARVWKLRPAIRSLGGLSIALQARLVELGSLREQVRRASDPEGYLLEHAPYSDLNFRDCVSHGIETHSVLTDGQRHSWALLFDEFEVAPSYIQRDILSNLRGQSETRLLYKVALAPYNKNFMQNVSDISAAPSHDFKVFNLWYPEKTRAYDFAEQLVTRLLEAEGIEVASLRKVFGESEFSFPEISDTKPYEEEGAVLEAFKRLANIDSSFRSHLQRKKVDLARIGQMTEEERAEKVRKLRSIVITREYFLRYDKVAPLRAIGRSRKIRTLYTGFPTILALCEGNPRLLIGITTPLARILKYIRQRHGTRGIDKSAQAAQIKQAANLFRSMLKTIPYREHPDHTQRGLLRLLDQVGEYFYRKCMLEEFSPQPPLSFIVDSNIGEETLSAIGRALNAGAIIYVPDPGADPILTSLRGKRFRLCYLLSAYYKLPITLNTSVALSTIIGSAKTRRVLPVQSNQAQLPLAGKSESDD